MKITPFHLYVVCRFANKQKHIKIITLVIDGLSFIRQTINCSTKHDQHRAQSILLSDMHTVGVHYVCHDIVSDWGGVL